MWVAQVVIFCAICVKSPSKYALPWTSKLTNIVENVKHSNSTYILNLVTYEVWTEWRKYIFNYHNLTRPVKRSRFFQANLFSASN